VRAAQKLIDASAFADQLALEARYDYEVVAEQMISDAVEPSAFQRQLASDAKERRMVTHLQAEIIWMDFIKAIQAADKLVVFNDVVY
jgi:hypothetical protein